MDALTLAQQIVGVIQQSGLDYSRRYLALDIARRLLEDSNYEPCQPASDVAAYIAPPASETVPASMRFDLSTMTTDQLAILADCVARLLVERVEDNDRDLGGRLQRALLRAMDAPHVDG